MKKLELIFIPLPGLGHLKSATECARHLLDRDERLSITFIVILPPSSTTYTKSPPTSDSRIKYTYIPAATPNSQPSPSLSLEKLTTLFIEWHKSHVEKVVMDLLSDDSTHLVGFVLDMFCSCMIDVANKFKVPSYIFFVSSIAYLGFLLHLPLLHKQLQDGVDFNPSDNQDLVIPSYKNPLPANLLPDSVFDKTNGGYEAFLYHATRFHESKGIIVNSFENLEPYAVNSMKSHAYPTVYPIGPLLNHNSHNQSTEIKNWLDKQPLNSVLFMCLGSRGTFNQPQIDQIATALLRSGQRFLWSIRKPPKNKFETPTDYTTYEKILPDGFLERVKERGMVCGWVPQVEVLAHGAVKGFVNHCGWNSLLESMCMLGLGVELSLTYRGGESELVMADEIERAVNRLMDDGNPVREKVKKISEESRKALINGGSSCVVIGKLTEDI
ncbi:hypothetical protein LXL04_010030 [Taraxacum kok-saghyz]